MNNKEEKRVYIQETRRNEDTSSMREIPHNPGLAQYSRNRPQLTLDSWFKQELENADTSPQEKWT